MERDAPKIKQSTKPEEAFAIVEVLESMLGNLDPKSLLQMTLINKHFESVIKASLPLQKVLFKINLSRIDPEDGVAEFNPLLIKSYSWRSEQKIYFDFPGDFQPSWYTSYHLSSETASGKPTFRMTAREFDAELDTVDSKYMPLLSMFLTSRNVSTRIELLTPGRKATAAVEVKAVPLGILLGIYKALLLANKWRRERMQVERQWKRLEDWEALLSWKAFFRPGTLMQYLFSVPEFENYSYGVSQAPGDDTLQPLGTGVYIVPSRFEKPFFVGQLVIE